jgi:hypothetical protein
LKERNNGTDMDGDIGGNLYEKEYTEFRLKERTNRPQKEGRCIMYYLIEKRRGMKMNISYYLDGHEVRT